VSATPAATPAELLRTATAIAPELARLRHDLHRVPEIGLDLPDTQALILRALEPLGLEVTTGTGLSSVTAVVRGARPGPAVLLRGDMDGLPVTEETGEPFTSERPGVMHACGHDLHVAGLVGAARLLAERRDEMAGSVVLMFQPGEEGYHGARLMLEEGVLDAAGERVVAAYGLHVVSAEVPVGVVTGRAGTYYAASDQLFVTVHGRGGHGSMPHLAADPVPVAAEIVLALQNVVTRQWDAQDPVVVTVGKIAAGTVDNVIPATAELAATVRTFSREAWAAVPDLLVRAVEHIAAAHGMTATADYVRGYPVLVNDDAETARAARVTEELGLTWVDAPQRITGSEDFSYVLEEVPGTYVSIGATPVDVDPAGAPYNHSALARFADEALPQGAALLAALALDRLAQG